MCQFQPILGKLLDAHIVSIKYDDMKNDGVISTPTCLTLDAAYMKEVERMEAQLKNVPAYVT